MHEDLKKAISRGLDCLTVGPYLKHNCRFEIYRALGPVCEKGIFLDDNTATQGVRRRTQRGIIEARRVVSLWGEVYPDEIAPTQHIQLIEEALAGCITKYNFVRSIQEFESKIERFHLGHLTNEQYKAAFAAACVFRTSICALSDWKYGFEIDWHNDPDVSIWMERNWMENDTADSAYYACESESSSFWREGFNPEASLKFWKWWLKEAVPHAYDSVGK